MENLIAEIKELRKYVMGSLNLRAVGGDHIINTLIQIEKKAAAIQAETPAEPEQTTP